jgi:hypothetical protein
MSQITEQFNDHHKRINVNVYTERLDDTEFDFVVNRFGLIPGQINHSYSAEKDVETIAGWIPR